MSINPITSFSSYQENLKITKDDFIKLQKNNAWILENKNYNTFFYENCETKKQT